ncbi:MAG: hypothetical protein DRR08_18085 [Candidatus Parabeggiatoa sp. nov. 2]|nr:MAG: hypothetical protein B6247_00750 [Beggiatoa sp. 4572_84]RKZ57803.1 MAG: hypothetical protein DRR08_18085 [Gammaproteobacteria bacterium]
MSSNQVRRLAFIFDSISLIKGYQGFEVLSNQVGCLLRSRLALSKDTKAADVSSNQVGRLFSIRLAAPLGLARL